MRKWLEDNSCNDLFSSSSSVSDSLVVITDDETEEGDRPAVSGSGSGDDDGSDSCMEMVRRIDGIANRAESMYNEQQFNLAVEKAAVEYACAEMARIANLDSESDMPSDSTILHVVSWIGIEVMSTCNRSQDHARTSKQSFVARDDNSQRVSGRSRRYNIDGLAEGGSPTPPVAFEMNIEYNRC